MSVVCRFFVGKEISEPFPLEVILTKISLKLNVRVLFTGFKSSLENWIMALFVGMLPLLYTQPRYRLHDF